MDVKANLIIFFTSICSLVGIGGLLAFFAARAARKERTADAKKADQELAEKAAKQAREEFAKKVPITSIPGDVVVAGDLATGEVSFENRAIVDLFVDYKNKEEMLKSYVRAMNAGTSYLKHFLTSAEIEKHTYGTSSRWQRTGPRSLGDAEIQKIPFVSSWDEFVARINSEEIQQKKEE